MAYKLSIDQVKKELLDALSNASNAQKLEEVRITFMGRSGKIADLMNMIKDLSVEEKRVYGPALNTLKKEAQEAYDLRNQEIATYTQSHSLEKVKTFDVTAGINPAFRGSLHLYTQITEHIETIFTSMGYTIMDGPEVETDYYNFESLNIASDHPARDMHDTFWLDVPGMLMRTHTSSVQAHAMEQGKPPLAVCVPGRVYRNEAVDATHNFMFTQVEGLFVDKNVGMPHLLATVEMFLQQLFESKNITIRVRPGYFPFVEPGVEIDASCPFCKEGCSICKKTRWIELLGAGLVHPNVLKCSGIDPEKYSGFAFGTGIERIAMIKHGITDIRLFHSSDVRFLDQF